MISFKNEKGFTLIELLAVIAIIAILVLIASPKILGYTKDAKLSQTKSDVKAYETAIASEVLDNDNFFDKLEVVSDEDIDKYFKEKNLFNKKGLIKDENDLKGNYFEIESKTLTKFAHIREIMDTLKSDKWTGILAHNKSSIKYYSWKDSQKILDGLMKSNYVKVSNFKTVENVLDYDKRANLKYKAHHTINSDSIVNEVYYDAKSCLKMSM